MCVLSHCYNFRIGWHRFITPFVLFCCCCFFRNNKFAPMYIHIFGLVSLFFFSNVVKQLFHFSTIQTYINDLRKCTYYILLCKFVSPYSKEASEKKDVIALGHSTFELANHSTFIDLHTNADSHPKDTHGYVYTTENITFCSFVRSCIRKYNFHLF